MATVIAIFDDSLALEKAIKQLTQQAFQEQVLDPVAFTGQEDDRPNATGELDSAASRPLPGILGGNLSDNRQVLDNVRAGRIVRDTLADADVPEEELEFYQQSFEHGGKLLIVDSEEERVDQAMAIIHAAGVSRVNRYD